MAFKYTNVYLNLSRADVIEHFESGNELLSFKSLRFLGVGSNLIFEFWKLEAESLQGFKTRSADSVL